MNRFPVATGPSTRVQFAQRFEMGAHEGTDIFGPAGAELIAVADGTVRQAKEPKGGFVVYLLDDAGTQYYYAHLDAFAYPMASHQRRKVKAGDVLGYMGTTGNAKGAPPHLHFEVKRKSGRKLDPFPMLERLSAAEETRLVAPRRKTPPPSKKRTRKRSPPRQGENGSPALGGGAIAFVAFYFLAKGMS